MKNVEQQTIKYKGQIIKNNETEKNYEFLNDMNKNFVIKFAIKQIKTKNENILKHKKEIIEKNESQLNLSDKYSKVLDDYIKLQEKYNDMIKDKQCL